jgi:Fic family protein
MTNPSYTLTEKSLNLIAQISEVVGQLNGSGEYQRNLHMRKTNRIRSIHSSLAIEANSLTPEQVTDIIDGKRVLGNPREIKEVKNAYEAYEHMLEFDPYSIDDLLAAHKYMAQDLVKYPGKFRSDNIGVYNGSKLLHPGARPEFVFGLVKELLNWAKNTETHPLIVSCIVHFELEIIHPFEDGNGRIGRLWQTLIMSKWRELFAWLPIETIVYENQQRYYYALSSSNAKVDSTDFVEFMLEAILTSLQELPVSKITDIITDIITDKLSKTELQFLESILGYMQNNTWITNYRAQLLTNKSTESVKKYFEKFVKLGIFESIGENKGRKYRLAFETGGAK